MDWAVGLGYVLGLLGLLGTVHYGRIGRETARAFARYRELDDALKQLQLEVTARDADIARLEHDKDEIFRLNSARAASPEAMRLARAAEQRYRARAREAASKPARVQFRYAAHGDQRLVVPELLASFESATREKATLRSATFHDTANLTLIAVEGSSWPKFLGGNATWRVFPEAVVKDWSSDAIIAWSKKAAEISRRVDLMTYSMSASKSGECLYIDVYTSPTEVCRLGLVATLEDHRPVPMARLFEGQTGSVESAYRQWATAHLAGL